MSSKKIFNINSELNYPTVLPTLNLDFGNSRTLDPRITFTRSSGGSYIGADGLIKYAGVNEPRFDHDPLTRESLGLLIEESRTNLMFPSNIASGGSGAVTLTTDTTVANPFGGFDGVLKCVHTVSRPGYFRRGKNITLTGGIPHTFSFYFKNGDERYNPFNQDPLNGIGMLSTTYSPVFTEFRTSLNKNVHVGNGWYRQILTYVPPANGSHAINFSMNTNQTPRYTFYLYGFQVEAGAYPSSYIPTTSAARTRAADNVSISGSNFNNFYKQNEGTFYVSFRKNDLGSTSEFPGIFYVDDTTSGNCIGSFINDSSNDRVVSESYKSGILQTSFLSSAVIRKNTLTRLSTAYKTNDFSTLTSLDTTVSSDISGFVPTVSRLLIGSSKENVYRLNGTISSLTYYPKRISDSQLQALTI